MLGGERNSSVLSPNYCHGCHFQLTVRDGAEPKNSWFVCICLQCYEASQSLQFCSAFTPPPRFHAVIHFPPPPPHNDDAVPWILPVKVCALSPNRRLSPGSYLSLGTNAAKPINPQSQWAHVAYKSVLMLIQRRSATLHGNGTPFSRWHNIAWFKNDFFRERPLKSLHWLMYHPTLQQTGTEKQQIPLPSPGGPAWGKNPLWDPRHVLQRVRHAERHMAIPEPRTNMFLTATALTAPWVAKEINIPLLISQPYFPRSLRGPSSVTTCKMNLFSAMTLTNLKNHSSTCCCWSMKMPSNLGRILPKEKKNTPSNS